MVYQKFDVAHHLRRLGEKLWGLLSFQFWFVALSFAARYAWVQAPDAKEDASEAGRINVHHAKLPTHSCSITLLLSDERTMGNSVIIA